MLLFHFAHCTIWWMPFLVHKNTCFLYHQPYCRRGGCWSGDFRPWSRQDSRGNQRCSVSHWLSRSKLCYVFIKTRNLAKPVFETHRLAYRPNASATKSKGSSVVMRESTQLVSVHTRTNVMGEQDTRVITASEYPVLIVINWIVKSNRQISWYINRKWVLVVVPPIVLCYRA